jgi:hypothetical protein
MKPSEKVEGAPRTRHAKNNGSPSNGHKSEHTRGSVHEIVKMGRGLGRRVQRDMETHPEALLIAVGGASFVVGAILGSRLGRLLLSAAIPLVLHHLVEGEVGPRLRGYVQDLLHGDDNAAT